MFTFKQKLAKNYINALGWKTKQKYLVIESDDWGAVRMPSKKVYNKLVKSNIPVNKDLMYFISVSFKCKGLRMRQSN